MVLSWQLVRFQLKETFAIAYGNYNFREALIVTLESHGCKGYGECTAIDYYHINLTDFTAILSKNKTQIETQALSHPNEFYSFWYPLICPHF